MKIENSLQKLFHPLRRILCATLVFFCLGHSYGQTENTPVSRISCGQTGNTLTCPIIVGTFGSAFQYSNSQNTDNFTNDYTGRPNHDVFYRFTLTVPMTVTISHCGSTLGDTYLHLLDASGSRIDYNDDYSGQCSSHYHSYLKKVLYAGTYYVVSEGFFQNGVILTAIEGNTLGANDALPSSIQAGTFASSFRYVNSQNTANLQNNLGRYTSEALYRFTLTSTMEITVSHCGSTLSDTYLYLLDASGNEIDRNDDYWYEGQCSNTYHSYLRKVLPPGSYYAVSEGYSQNGIIQTSITGDTDITGNTFRKPIVIGSSNSSFQYENTQNTAYFTNDYANRTSKDVFYRFTLATMMEVTISHCGSVLSDTYLHLLDASGNRIAYNNDYSGEDKCSSSAHSYLKKMLSAGTYYVVSEGYSQNGEIKTAVEGKIPTLAYSYDAAGNRTSRQWNDGTVSLRAASLVPEEKDDRGLLEKEEEEIRAKSRREEEMAASDAKINIFPNPTRGLLTVEISGYIAQTGEIRLFSPEGQTLEVRKIVAGSTRLDLSAFPKGIYLLYVQLDGDAVYQKIMKE
jgi:hypothetical protein